MSVTINGTNGLTFNDASTQNTAATGFGFKNRIINGAMMIDQRNAGASVTPADNAYLVDRFQYNAAQASKFTAQQNAGAVTPPTGFVNYLGFTSSSSYSVLTGDYFFTRQSIEGLNVSDLAWGTASAAPVTISFWVRSSLTGTFGGTLENSAGNRCYPFSYTISVANTWEQKTVTIAGDTTGTWLTTNGKGIVLLFSLGAGSTYTGTAGSWGATRYFGVTGQQNVVGTNGATFYITGVQLEKGSTATSFDYRPYGTELALCQRYFEKGYDVGIVPGTVAANGYVIAPTGTNTVAAGTVFNGPQYKVNKRITSPTITIYGYNGGTGRVSNASTGADLGASSGTINSYGESAFSVYNNNGASLATNSYGVIYNWTSSAEL